MSASFLGMPIDEVENDIFSLFQRMKVQKRTKGTVPRHKRKSNPLLIVDKEQKKLTYFVNYQKQEW